MQTFMPFNDFHHSAMALDSKRLNKQRIEAWQILKTLRGEYASTGAWSNHPAVIMWQGYEQSLIEYGLEMCREWSARGGADTSNLTGRFASLSEHWQDPPWWVNYEPVLISHRSNLQRKDPEYYKFGAPDNLPYVWPKPDGTWKVGAIPEKVENVLPILRK